jgi:hypothetical protein
VACDGNNKVRVGDIPCCGYLMQLAAGGGLCTSEIWCRYRTAGEYAAWYARHPGFKCKEACCPAGNVPIEVFNCLPAAPAGFIGRVRVSMQSTLNAVNLCAELARHIIETNLDQPAYVVTTLILYVDSLLDQKHRRVALALANTPLKEWDARQTYTIETIARNGVHLDGRGPIPNYRHTSVARIKTLLGRDLRGHDVEAELSERSTVTIPHSYNVLEVSNCDCWTNDLAYTLKKYTHEAVSSAPTTPQSANSWWANRAMWLSGGSSKGFKVQHSLQQLLLDKRIIATKRLIGSHQPMGWFKCVMASEPIMHARAATKNEPGLKRRPLRATDDASYMVAAFASNNMEKYLSINGTVMRQTPADVQATTNNILRANARNANIVLCVDYANFNNTHTTRARALANLAMATAYTTYGHNEQAEAAIWMATAQLNHWLGGTLSNQGLSSGERDTARDNTMLHYAYSNLAFNELATQCPGWKPPASMHMCGDDEIATGLSWSNAVIYCRTLELHGHALQRRKLLLSTGTGEFLQYNMKAEGPNIPQQPLAPALLNFVSGSWYKTSAYNTMDYPSQVSEAAASCVRRGASPATMRQLAISTVSWLAKETPWRTALSNTNLFGATQAAPAWIRTKSTLPSQLSREHKPSGASEYVQGLANKMRLNSQELLLVRQYTDDTIYASVCANVRASREADKLANANHTDIERIDTHLLMPDKKDLATKWLNATSQDRGDSTTWLAVQLGMPLPLVEKIGLHNIVARASNQMRQHINFNQPEPKHRIHPLLMAALPGALVPYFEIEK